VEAAIADAARAAAIAPAVAAYRMSLGNALKAGGRAQEAAARFAEAARLEPERIEPRFNLANTLYALGQWDVAQRAYRAIIALDPGIDGAYVNLGAMLMAAGQPAQAAQTLRQAGTLNANHAGAANNLGNALQALGQAEQALAAYRRASDLAPDDIVIRRNQILCMNLSEQVSGADILAAGLLWHARFAPPRPESRHAHVRAPDRPLRLGYLSAGMFRRHTLANVMMPLIEGHRTAGTDVTIYSDLPAGREDEISARFAQTARWQRTGGLGDRQLAQRIRDDGIDILVDAVGYVDGSRLLALAEHPAPIQVTIPLMGTVGGHTIDYVIADEHLISSDMEPCFSERIERVPFAYRFDPLGATPDPEPPPVLRHGFITFGSMNTLSKIGPAAIATWARLLRTVPESRLLIKAQALGDADAVALVRRHFADYGIAAERLDLRRWAASHAHHLAVYNDIDIALDSFPYGGVTTTCEALWMGVPVVTLIGDRVLGRYGLTLLTAVGFDAGIARSHDD
ncbi:MAG: tetratricopeptide repeat protein, partial [Alphaproteobacteria bacterium]|nr:tetratricopeptide repeat protein [Alphaproteobacteria bacterium]